MVARPSGQIRKNRVFEIGRICHFVGFPKILRKSSFIPAVGMTA